MSQPRPVAGVICCTRNVGGEPAQTVINRYLEGPLAYSDCALLLVPSFSSAMRASEVASRLDGLLLTGSPSNVAPRRYRDSTTDAPGPFDPGRDAMTLDLINTMANLGKPVFGICRGFQEINVAFGGTLRRDMAAADRPLRHHAPADAGFDDMFEYGHPVDLTPGGVLSSTFGVDRTQVNSVHFQGVDQLGEGLTVEAVADDGVIEAVSGRSGGAPLLAVQWHPEWRTSQNPQSIAYFELFGRALRGAPLIV